MYVAVVDEGHDVWGDLLAVEGFDEDLYFVNGILEAFPVDVDESGAIFVAEALDVLTFTMMHGDAAATGDVADDRVAWHRFAAVGEFHIDVAHALDGNAADVFLAGAAVGFGVELIFQDFFVVLGFELGELALEFVAHAVDDLHGADAADADADVEIVGGFITELVGDAIDVVDVQQDGFCTGVVRFDVAFEGFLAVVQIFLALVFLEPGTDLVLGLWGFNELEPVAVWSAAVFGAQDLDGIAGLQLVIEWHDLAVDFCADALVTDLGVDTVSKVKRRGAGWQLVDFAGW